MLRRTSPCLVLMAGLVPWLLAATPAASWHWDWDGDRDEEEGEEESPFDVAEIYVELNDTDEDLGLHALIDGEGWDRLEIEDPHERKMLDVKLRGRLGRQGLTELFFESAEPNFADLSPEEFFRRFKAGTYEIEGRTLEGEELESEAGLTHVIPAPAGNFTINGEPARPEDGSDCDEEEPTELEVPIVIEFDAVTSTHPDLGVMDPDIEIVHYQVVAEWEDEDENAFVSSSDLKPVAGQARYSLSVPSEFTVPGTEIKFEVLAREASHNQTAVESCPFEIAEP